MPTNSNPTAANPPMFPTVSMPVFFGLTIATLGLYHLYWFYRAWKIVGARTGRRISPLARTLFGIFYIRQLFGAIEEAAVETGHPAFNGPTLGTAYLLAGFMSRAIPYLWIGQILVLARVQSNINAMNDGITTLDLDTRRMAA